MAPHRKDPTNQNVTAPRVQVKRKKRRVGSRRSIFEWGSMFTYDELSLGLSYKTAHLAANTLVVRCDGKDIGILEPQGSRVKARCHHGLVLIETGTMLEELSCFSKTSHDKQIKKIIV